jgi:autotransporter-associated beta strand protein
MKKLALLSLIASSLIALYVPHSYGQATSTETWNGAGTTFNTAADWSGALIPNSSVFCILNGNSANRVITISAFRSHANGLRFDSAPNGFTFVNASSATAGELAPRGSGTISGPTGNDIVNNSGQTVTFNCPVRFYSFGAGTLNATDIQYIKTTSGNIGFNTGAFFAGTTDFALGANGGTLAFDASVGNTITVGASTTPGVIWAGGAGAGGLIKNGAGTLVLAGNAANTYGGAGTATTTINAGIVTVQKVGAFGSGNKMILNGGTLNSGGIGQTIGTLDLEGVTTISLSGAGSGTLGFANSSAVTWGAGGLLDFEGFTGGTQVRFGADTTGLTVGQLAQIELNGVAGEAGLDPSGYLIMLAVPEPSALALGLLGGFAVVAGTAARRRKV